MRRVGMQYQSFFDKSRKDEANSRAQSTATPSQDGGRPQYIKVRDSRKFPYVTEKKPSSVGIGILLQR